MRAATLTAVTAQFHPTRDNVLIRRRASEKATTLGILIPDAVHKPLNRGSVVAVGSGRRTSNGTLIPPAVAPGDEILLTPDSGIEITVAGEQLIVASEQDVLGVFIAPDRDDQPSQEPIDGAERISGWERELSANAREEALETDVAPDVLDREPPTAEDLH